MSNQGVRRNGPVKLYYAHYLLQVVAGVA
uniref:Uncharacterized protein n=1 Tax=Neogobius melanostomus TaxID=47308 RepID=A0A8C6U2Q8_9GOBI